MCTNEGHWNIVGRRRKFEKGFYKISNISWKNRDFSLLGPQPDRSNHCDHARTGHNRLDVSINVRETPAPLDHFWDYRSTRPGVAMSLHGEMIGRVAGDSEFQISTRSSETH